MQDFRIDHPHNEASTLVAIHDHALLEARGWEVAFWIASDERPAREAIAALGRAKDGEWSVVPLKTTASAISDSKPAEDCETLTRAGSWIYVFGSQYGSKKGPLQPKRHFVGRFNEALVRSGKKSLHAELDLTRKPFVLHRLVNDALRKRRIALIAPPDDFVERTIELAREEKKAWADRVQPKDSAINVEGAAFLPNGHLLLGLRYPTTAVGHPLLVEVEGIDRLFEDGELSVAAVWIVESVGTKKAPAGVRELDARGARLHAILGALDNPGLEGAPNEHHVIAVPARKRGTTVRVTSKRIRRFDEDSNVEGLAVQDDGTVWYVHDDEQIRLAVASL